MKIKALKQMFTGRMKVFPAVGLAQSSILVAGTGVQSVVAVVDVPQDEAKQALQGGGVLEYDAKELQQDNVVRGMYNEAIGMLNSGTDDSAVSVTVPAALLAVLAAESGSESMTLTLRKRALTIECPLLPDGKRARADAVYDLLTVVLPKCAGDVTTVVLASEPTYVRTAQLDYLTCAGHVGLTVEQSAPAETGGVRIKEPWEMTGQEFLYIPADQMREYSRRNVTHRDLIEEALAVGKVVPLEVLAEYPDLRVAQIEEIMELSDLDGEEVLEDA